MKFTSLEFLVFLPITWIIYLVLPVTKRWVWLLVASCFFYARFVPEYLWVMIILAFVDWWAGLSIESSEGKKKKWILIAAITIQLVQLAIFKYLAFFAENFNSFMSSINVSYQAKAVHFLLPLGLSFHTFQSISYLTDIYRREEKSEKNYFRVLFFIIFFPQLVAGPIERASHLLKEIRSNPLLKKETFYSGLALIFYGFFKKLVIADNASLIVDTIYNDIPTFNGLAIWLANYLFWIQIYFDFSGYIAIAQGCAKIFGYELMENFNRPYTSQSVADFWQRWHISLSSWFRDYVYNPLMMSGEYISVTKLYWVTVFVFFLSGLWHGPNWTYVFFGLFHGVCIAASIYFKSYWNKIHKKLGVNKKSNGYRNFQIFVTFHLILLSWILFRSTSLSQATSVFYGLMSLNPIPFEKLPNEPKIQISLIFLSVLIIAVWRHYWDQLAVKFKRNDISFYVIVFVLIYYFLLSARFNAQDFIYFQF